jgi:hypothetical protein
MSEAASKTTKDPAVGQSKAREPNVRHSVPTGPYSDILTLQQTVGNRAVTQAIEGSNASGIPPVVQSVLNSGSGQPLDPGTRAYMESRFGEDFSGVRVHTDANAADSARGVNANAYTVGRDVVFDAGQYAPNTIEGQKVLAHELAHVVQQSRGGAVPSVSSHASHEHSASNTAKNIVTTPHNSVGVQGATEVGLARQEKLKQPDRKIDIIIGPSGIMVGPQGGFELLGFRPQTEELVLVYNNAKSKGGPEAFSLFGGKGVPGSVPSDLNHMIVQIASLKSYPYRDRLSQQLSKVQRAITKGAIPNNISLYISNDAGFKQQSMLKNLLEGRRIFIENLTAQQLTEVSIKGIQSLEHSREEPREAPQQVRELTPEQRIAQTTSLLKVPMRKRILYGEGVGQCDISSNPIIGGLMGEFKEDPTFSMIGVDLVTSLIPIIDTAADVRDLTAHLYYMTEKKQYGEHMRWVGWPLLLSDFSRKLAVLSSQPVSFLSRAEVRQ